MEAAHTPDDEFEMAARVKGSDEMLTTESDESAGHVVVKKEAGTTVVVEASAGLTATLSPVVVMKDEEGAEASASGRQDQIVEKKEVDSAADSPPAGLPAQIGAHSSHESGGEIGQRLIPFRIERYRKGQGDNSKKFGLSRKLSGWPDVYVTRILKKGHLDYTYYLVTDEPVPDPRRFPVMNGMSFNS